MKNPYLKLKNLLAKMIGELYFPQYQSDTYAGADIPTRETVDQYLPKVLKALEAADLTGKKGDRLRVPTTSGKEYVWQLIEVNKI